LFKDVETNGGNARMRESTQQSVLFPEALEKPVTVVFDGEAESSDGGGLLLGAVDRRWGLTEQLVEALGDKRKPERIAHSHLELFRQRVFALALGYADGNDAQELRHDPVLKPLCGRAPISGPALASQPTVSRFENAVTPRQLVALTRRLEQAVIARLKQRHPKARKIVIDLDGTADPTHGQQFLSFFNGYYDSWCYLPLVGFLTVDDDSEQYLFAARLRPGNASTWRGAVPLLRRTVQQLRALFPKARLFVRLDGGFASPTVLRVLEQLDVRYVVVLTGNAVLLRLAEPALQQARTRVQATGLSQLVWTEGPYCSKSWPHERRVIVKAEVVSLAGREPRDNPRYVVTNLSWKPESVYDFYRVRGDSENRIKELKNDLELGRTSCSQFRANALRVLFSATAFALCQELRWRLRRTELKRATVQTLRLRLFKIGARIVESVRRIVLHFPVAYPWRDLWCLAARSVGAVPT
jgi:hypothetical protein